jgi:hypothetical protein
VPVQALGVAADGRRLLLDSDVGVPAGGVLAQGEVAVGGGQRAPQRLEEPGREGMRVLLGREDRASPGAGAVAVVDLPPPAVLPVADLELAAPCFSTK